jgi:hypothetical protein
VRSTLSAHLRGLGMIVSLTGGATLYLPKSHSYVSANSAGSTCFRVHQGLLLNLVEVCWGKLVRSGELLVLAIDDLTFATYLAVLWHHHVHATFIAQGIPGRHRYRSV